MSTIPEQDPAQKPLPSYISPKGVEVVIVYRDVTPQIRAATVRVIKAILDKVPR